MLEQKGAFVISNRQAGKGICHGPKTRGRVSKRRNEEYYEFSPLGFLGDSYFTQSPFYSNDPNESAQIGLGPEPSSNYTAPAPHVVEHTGYSPFYPQTEMDLDVLSAENYHPTEYAQANAVQRGRDPAPLFGITDSRLRTVTPSPPAGTRARRPRKESLKGASADEANSARQRGRPRLDTKDQTAAEVCILLSLDTVFCRMLALRGLYHRDLQLEASITLELT